MLERPLFGLRLWFYLEQGLGVRFPLETLRADMTPRTLVAAIEKDLNLSDRKFDVDLDRQRLPLVFGMPTALGDLPDLARFRATLEDVIRFGAVISPLLANIYLHYVYDLWVQHWRQRSAKGDVIVVRYADDTIVGFEHWHEAEQFLADLKMRLARFGLVLHPDKTRLIEFGRFAIANRRARGLGNPESFDFLGFTHYCANRRDGGGFILGRKPVRTRMRAKLRAIKGHLQAMQHDGIERQGRWLAQVLRGRLAYYAVPMSGPVITAFRHHMIERWLRVLQRRSQRTRRSLSWSRMKRIADYYLPARASCIRGPNNGSSSPSKARARCLSSARRDLSGGRSANCSCRRWESKLASRRQVARTPFSTAQQPQPVSTLAKIRSKSLVLMVVAPSCCVGSGRVAKLKYARYLIGTPVLCQTTQLRINEPRAPQYPLRFSYAGQPSALWRTGAGAWADDRGVATP
jgi:hypothetical protein